MFSSSTIIRFKDRISAGQQLAQAIKSRLQNTIPTHKLVVVSLPRGGVVVGEEIAKELGCDHSLVFPRKIGMPGQSEVALGAVTEYGELYWNQFALQGRYNNMKMVKDIVEKEQKEAQRRKSTYTKQGNIDFSKYSLVIVTDDALATGATMKSAIATVKHHGGQNILVAVPVSPSETIQELKDMGVEILCLTQPKNFRAASLWFDDWSEVSDDQVKSIMRKYDPKPDTEETKSQNQQQTQPASITNIEKPLSGISVKTESLTMQISSGVKISADLNLISPSELQKGLVIFAHGSGSSRKSSRNQYVAKILNQSGIATFLLDLLSVEEEILDRDRAHLRFNIKFLTDRLIRATQILMEKHPQLNNNNIGLFGASTGSAAAIETGIKLSEKKYKVTAIVSRGGRPDMVEKQNLNKLNIPTLLIVGGLDNTVIKLNYDAFHQMKQLIPNKTKLISIIPGATHLFEEIGTLEAAAKAANEWFLQWFTSSSSSSTSRTVAESSRLQKTDINTNISQHSEIPSAH